MDPEAASAGSVTSIVHSRGEAGSETAFAATVASPAQAAFHLWGINEIYSNSSGTLQFIELQTPFGGQQFVGGQTITVSSGAMSHAFTVPANLPGDTTNHFFLIGTPGIQAAGGPAPDYPMLPAGFLFTGGGTINFWGTNSAAYSALPLDGLMSRNWTTMTNNLVNSPTNFAGATGIVNGVPEPATMILTPIGTPLKIGRAHV